MEGQREAMAAKSRRTTSGTGSSDSIREAREAEVESKVHKYMVELADKRKQAGIISTPSTELLEAERRLAEVQYNECILVTDYNQEFTLVPYFHECWR